jgi:hypothetical protein
VPGDHHHRPASHAVVDVRPGDQDAATTVEAWLQDYATSRDPQLRERIILAYLGVADRLARRFRDSRGTSAEDLVQTDRAGSIAAIDRYDPGSGTPVRPLRRGLCGRQAQMPPARHQLAAPYCLAAQGTIPAAVPGSR